MRRALLVTIALIVPVTAETAPPKPAALRAALVKVGAEVAALAYFTGTCEHHYTPESTAALAARFTGAGASYDDKFQATIGRVWAQSYGEGRRDAEKNDWSEEYCARVTKEAIANADAYTAELRSLQRAKP